ncbi:M13 family metallopeptidase [Woodsholea maritima]|uniref:M13 family metallopeptidase n=1 Tax=Woodsholea maritima TaxID=240237 RepID=UPI00037DFD6F|nr:M13 family metallopeptidase [Woodsholea maritima]
MKHLLLGTSALVLIALSACTPDSGQANQTTHAQTHEQASVETPVYGQWGFDIAGMNTEVHPGDDFFAYASGTWDETTQIPSDRSRYGMFTVLSLKVEDQVKAIIEDTDATGQPKGSNAQLVSDLYASWMNADAIEAAGTAPLQPYLEEISTAQSHDDIAALFATVQHASLYALPVWADPSDPSINALRVYQSGLSLPDRNYYLDEGERFAEYRAKFRDYIITLFTLADIEDAETKADAIIDFETRIAEVHWSREDSRDITKTYNVVSIDDLAERAPAFNIHESFEALGLGNVENAILVQPSAFEGMSEIFANTDVDTLKAYMTFHFIDNRTSQLPAAFDEASFDFYSRTLNGQEEQRPRDKRGVGLVGGALGHAVGQIYVERHFPESSKTQMDELVANLRTAFRGRLENLSWMDDETRVQALEKLSTFEPRIGYPEIWDEYDGLDIRADDYFGNRMRMAEFNWQENVKDLAEPVDRREWSWPPQIVNASYNSLMNQITFPAGILQAPFFDPYADPAINYGGIGGVIGHEIGHGFDDQGRQYDAQGLLRDWWTEDTKAQFIERSDALVAQYDGFSPIEGENVNGRLTLGENIGDLGGLQMAYSAWREYADAHYENGEAPVIDGFTGDQRFFLGWAQVWRAKAREDALRAQLNTDPHSPALYRVNGVVRNLDAWYEAFGVTEDNALYLPPEQRVKIW